MLKIIKRLSPPRIIAIGFVLVILLGSAILSLPFCLKDASQVRYIDTLYTATSAVCVTGLTTIDVGNTFTPIGQGVLAFLIQIGGLGVACVGAGIILMMGKKMGTKGRNLVREASNLTSAKGVMSFVKDVFFLTLFFEIVGAVLSFIAFSKDYPFFDAVGISIFHSVSSFNNAGFDILGNFKSLSGYADNLFLNFTTAFLIFFGGIGFLVIKEVIQKKFKWKLFSMHTKIVLTTSAVLIFAGTLLIKLSENVSWLGAFFMSVSTRTAGFATFDLGAFSNATLLVMMALMFIGASPGSTGGGIKTSTFFALLAGIKSAATNKSEKAFKFSFPKEAFKKASIIISLALGVVVTGTYLLTIMEPQVEFIDAFFEIVSAFGTVGLSTGITTGLSDGGKILSMIIMYIGRLGPLTIATLWYFSHGERVEYPEGNIAIG